MAQRGYQANLAVVDRAQEAYQAALQLGTRLMSGISAVGGFVPFSIPTAITPAAVPERVTPTAADADRRCRLRGGPRAGPGEPAADCRPTPTTWRCKAATGDLTDVHDYMIASDAGAARHRAHRDHAQQGASTRSTRS